MKATKLAKKYKKLEPKEKIRFNRLMTIQGKDEQQKLMDMKHELVHELSKIKGENGCKVFNEEFLKKHIIGENHEQHESNESK